MRRFEELSAPFFDASKEIISLTKFDYALAVKFKICTDQLAGFFFYRDEGADLSLSRDISLNDDEKKENIEFFKSSAGGIFSRNNFWVLFCCLASAGDSSHLTSRHRYLAKILKELVSTGFELPPLENFMPTKARCEIVISRFYASEGYDYLLFDYLLFISEYNFCSTLVDLVGSDTKCWEIVFRPYFTEGVKRFKPFVDERKYTTQPMSAYSDLENYRPFLPIFKDFAETFFKLCFRNVTILDDLQNSKIAALLDIFESDYKFPLHRTRQLKFDDFQAISLFGQNPKIFFAVLNYIFFGDWAIGSGDRQPFSGQFENFILGVSSIIKNNKALDDFIRLNEKSMSIWSLLILFRAGSDNIFNLLKSKFCKLDFQSFSEFRSRYTSDPSNSSYLIRYLIINNKDLISKIESENDTIKNNFYSAVANCYVECLNQESEYLHYSIYSTKKYIELLIRTMNTSNERLLQAKLQSNNNNSLPTTFGQWIFQSFVSTLTHQMRYHVEDGYNVMPDINSPLLETFADPKGKIYNLYQQADKKHKETFSSCMSEFVNPAPDRRDTFYAPLYWSIFFARYADPTVVLQRINQIDWKRVAKRDFLYGELYDVHRFFYQIPIDLVTFLLDTSSSISVEYKLDERVVFIFRCIIRQDIPPGSPAREALLEIVYGLKLPQYGILLIEEKKLIEVSASVEQERYIIGELAELSKKTQGSLGKSNGLIVAWRHAGLPVCGQFIELKRGENIVFEHVDTTDLDSVRWMKDQLEIYKDRPLEVRRFAVRCWKENAYERKSKKNEDINYFLPKTHWGFPSTTCVFQNADTTHEHLINNGFFHGVSSVVFYKAYLLGTSLTFNDLFDVSNGLVHRKAAVRAFSEILYRECVGWGDRASFDMLARFCELTANSNDADFGGYLISEQEILLSSLFGYLKDVHNSDTFVKIAEFMRHTRKPKNILMALDFVLSIVFFSKNYFNTLNQPPFLRFSESLPRLPIVDQLTMFCMVLDYSNSYEGDVEKLFELFGVRWFLEQLIESLTKSSPEVLRALLFFELQKSSQPMRRPDVNKRILGIIEKSDDKFGLFLSALCCLLYPRDNVSEEFNSMAEDRIRSLELIIENKDADIKYRISSVLFLTDIYMGVVPGLQIQAPAVLKDRDNISFEASLMEAESPKITGMIASYVYLSWLVFDVTDKCTPEYDSLLRTRTMVASMLCCNEGWSNHDYKMPLLIYLHLLQQINVGPHGEAMVNDVLKTFKWDKDNLMSRCTDKEYKEIMQLCPDVLKPKLERKRTSSALQGGLFGLVSTDESKLISNSMDPGGF